MIRFRGCILIIIISVGGAGPDDRSLKLGGTLSRGLIDIGKHGDLTNVDYTQAQLPIPLVAKLANGDPTVTYYEEAKSSIGVGVTYPIRRVNGKAVPLEGNLVTSITLNFYRKDVCVNANEIEFVLGDKYKPQLEGFLRNNWTIVLSGTSEEGVTLVLPRFESRDQCFNLISLVQSKPI